MKCPYCKNEDSRVVDSREIEEGQVIRRRRECPQCGRRFSTYEQVEILQLVVIKKDETREDYSKEKLLEGLRRATKKRLGEEKLDRLFGEIENEIHSLGKTDISSKEIGNMVMRKLQAEDEVSYLRFASVFKSFGSGKRFLKELNRLEEN